MSKILLVDDEQENLRSLRRYLVASCPDWEISTASNEDQAVEILRRHMFDLVITDLVMNDEQSGMKVLATVKAEFPMTMVILITAFETKLDRYRAFDLGAFDCIQKNMPRVNAAEEILVKARAAIRFRELALEQVKAQTRLAVLNRYFDPRVLKAIDSKPQMLDLHERNITICFWDIRGFSLLCEVLKAYPKLISGFLAEYFEMAAEIIFDHGGVLDKYIGDGVMGLFGALNGSDEESTKKSATNAVKAAIRLREMFDNLLAKWVPEWTLYTAHKIDIGLGCGIHTGAVLVGNVGTERRDQYTALGPNVNLAARLESRAGKRQILVSATTEIRIRQQFILSEVDEINDIKNISGSYKLYEVDHAKVDSVP